MTRVIDSLCDLEIRLSGISSLRSGLGKDARCTTVLRKHRFSNGFFKSIKKAPNFFLDIRDKIVELLLRRQTSVVVNLPIECPLPLNLFHRAAAIEWWDLWLLKTKDFWRLFRSATGSSILGVHKYFLQVPRKFP